MAYETTTVTVERSQGEIRKLLQDRGAARFAFGEETDSAGVRWAAVSFTHGAHAVRMRVPHKPVDERVVRSRLTRARTKTREDLERELGEQEAKRIWRVMHWNLKARLVAVDEGVETFEEAFLAHLLNERTGMTIFETLAEHGTIELGAPLRPQLEAGDR
jgi:hypothetical protein